MSQNLEGQRPRSCNPRLRFQKVSQHCLFSQQWEASAGQQSSVIDWRCLSQIKLSALPRDPDLSEMLNVITYTRSSACMCGVFFDNIESMVCGSASGISWAVHSGILGWSDVKCSDQRQGMNRSVRTNHMA